MNNFKQLAIDVYTELALDGNTTGVSFNSEYATITCNGFDYKIPADTDLSVTDWVRKIEGMSNG